ncbi:MAG: NusG domain II-containing protein [Clostridia bacterium]|nr:NusG domain II-containing protein [Clostridia bacterium]MBQ3229315.1 NusG domain II-containing protein [Clostridia bacterium]MBR4062968.1 NusG domain II-containing protein [Clostridia bacterium]
MKKRDIILIASILVVAIAFFLIVELTKEEGAGVVVKVDGVEVAEYSLSKSGTYPLNGGTNILVIEDGRAYLSDANCPDKLCVHQGKISRTGEVITCLPNKLTVTVFGAEESVDLIS